VVTSHVPHVRKQIQKSDSLKRWIENESFGLFLSFLWKPTKSWWLAFVRSPK
jgi:hypothetical protein